MFVGIADTFVVCFFSEADGSVILSVLAWIGIIVFERPVLTFDSQCATAIGSGISFVIMLTHFISKPCWWQPKSILSDRKSCVPVDSTGNGELDIACNLGASVGLQNVSTVWKIRFKNTKKINYI